MNMQLENVKLDRIAPDPGQPRKTEPMTGELLEYLKGLGNSIRKEGLNNPVKLRPNTDEKVDADFIIINGECRWRACVMAGLKEIPAFIDESGKSSGEVYLDQILDNETRMNLPPMDTIESYRKALDMGIDIERLAAAVGKSEATIMADLPLLDLPEKAKKLVDAGVMSKAVARKIAEFPNSVKMEKALEWAMKGSNAKEQLAKIAAYSCEANQGNIFSILKAQVKDDKEFNEELKTAGKIFDKLAASITTFANSKFANGKGQFVICARKRELQNLETIAAKMVRIGQKLQEDALLFRAQDKNAAMK